MMRATCVCVCVCVNLLTSWQRGRCLCGVATYQRARAAAHASATLPTVGVEGGRVRACWVVGGGGVGAVSFLRA